MPKGPELNAWDEFVVQQRAGLIELQPSRDDMVAGDQFTQIDSSTTADG
ncbi:hypothetical protein [Paractinoplanes globisporus]|uniref:Uncharacterized protein n=1 Tax=Paractinoplanes globisporus TaxID=113565 RepID=A0ABW6WCH8_9ACTN|nr:hypothetical protein [Actinoplanes globisporus]